MNLTIEALLAVCGEARLAASALPAEITVSPDMAHVAYEAMSKPTSRAPAGVEMHIDSRLPAQTWHEGPPQRPPTSKVRTYGTESEHCCLTRKMMLIHDCPVCPQHVAVEWDPPPAELPPFDPMFEQREVERARAITERDRRLEIAASAYGRHLCSAKGSASR
jgi:hypothetical protein